MCDTIVNVGDGEVLFAKNSDRDANEAQILDWQPRRSNAPGSMLRCTYIEIAQVDETAAVLLSRPFWMWGAEMGANEHGVVIGNEAVFTRAPKSDTGLTGMDLLRLGLERSRSAAEAVEVMITLLELHGQGGGCGFEDRSFTYHNSYIIADPNGATVLETAAKDWAVETVHGARSISNGLTIPGFAGEHSDRLKTWASACRIRQPRTQHRAQSAENVVDMSTILRDHGGERWPSYKRINGTLHMACMHGGSEIASSISAGSWVSRLTTAGNEHWVTATSSPCLSLFKPVAVGCPIGLGTSPEGTADDSLWWTHERLHRRVMANPARLSGHIIEERDALESEWFSQPPESAEAFATHRECLQRWTRELPDNVGDVRPGHARRYWAKRDRWAGLS